MMIHGRWETLTSRLYYSLGATYYLYKWIAATGAIGVALSVIGGYAALPAVGTAIGIMLSLPVASWGGYIAIKRRANQLQSHNPSLKILFSEQTYEILGNDRFRSSRRLIVKALADGVSKFEHKFDWSGAGHISVSSTTSGVTAAMSDEKYGTNKVCTCDFGKQLRKGETLEFSYHIDLEDSGKKAQPYFSQTMTYGIDEVMLRVVFPADGSIRNYRKQILLSHASTIPIWDEALTFPLGSREASWRIKRPRLHHRYRIVWA